MQKRFRQALLPVLVSLSCAAQASGPVEWGYSGDIGPEHWAALAPEFSTCASGMNQSPIDIDPRTDVVDAKLPGIKFDYTMLIPERIHHNGHTVQVDLRSGGKIEVDGKSFSLKQFHFHTPSENLIEGKHFPLEIHFVHASESGELAVVAMLLQPGGPNQTIDRLWKSLPQEKGQEVRLDSHALQALEMDRTETNYFRFNGSLTTPPCSEGVTWIVLRTPTSVSRSQVEALQKVLKHPNNRPVQLVNARRVMN